MKTHLYLRLICMYLSAQVDCMSKVCATDGGQTNWSKLLTQNHFFLLFPTLLLLCYWPHHSCPSLHFWKKLSFLSYWCNMNCRIGDTGNGGICCQCSDSIYYIISLLNISGASLPLWAGEKTTMNNHKIQWCCLLCT